MTAFDVDTAVERAGTHLFTAHIDPKWWVLRGPNGGYVAAILQRAMTEAVGEPDRPARSLTVHFIVPPDLGAVQVHTQIERRGGSLTSVSARLVQGDRVVATAVGAFSARRRSVEYAELEMPEVPSPGEVASRVIEGAPPHAQMLDWKPAIGSVDFAAGDRAITGGWFRLREPQLADPVVLTSYADNWFPALFFRTREPVGVPTVDFTMHFRTGLPLPNARPEDYYLVVFRAPISHDGFVVEDGEIWSEEGQLLAQSRQLAVVLSR
ncbi:MAG: thioesterase family protein [Acidimicrobiia bacterium]|nr:thioesterase family protein [Acidimicrobiia bacterium]